MKRIVICPTLKSHVGLGWGILRAHASDLPCWTSHDIDDTADPQNEQDHNADVASRIITIIKMF